MVEQNKSLYKTLRLELGRRSYDIRIGRGLLSDTTCFEPFLDGRSTVIVSDETVAALYLEGLKKILKPRQTVIIGLGEACKTLDTMSLISARLLEKNMDRQTVLLALGGGIVGDITGFTAACYQRGIDFVQLPTTLLAQVDSSVGGKTAVNHPLGKNMIGAFHQPRAVVIDLDTLATLPDRELTAGLAEVIKYGLIEDADFFAWLEDNIDHLRKRENGTFDQQNYQALAYAVWRSCAIKAAIVERDEYESGPRMLLNLGHTFAHAIETGSAYQYLHGEAVACGLALAMKLSTRLGHTDGTQLERVLRLLKRVGLPIKAPDSCSPELMLELMARDKKNRKGKQSLVLLKAIGQAYVEPAIEREVLEAFLKNSQ